MMGLNPMTFYFFRIQPYNSALVGKFTGGSFNTVAGIFLLFLPSPSPFSLNILVLFFHPLLLLPLLLSSHLESNMFQGYAGMAFAVMKPVSPVLLTAALAVLPSSLYCSPTLFFYHHPY